jgi:hypothetical protein
VIRRRRPGFPRLIDRALTCSAFLAVVILARHPLPSRAEPTLMGRTVSLHILTYDDPDKPLFVGRVHKSRVTDGVEFGLGTEGAQNNLDVVPILVDVSDTRVEVRYSVAEPGELAEARFNGYVLSFASDCLLFRNAWVDRAFSNLPMTNSRVSFDGGTLFLDVSGFRHDRDSRFAIDLDLAECRSA